MTTRLYCGIDLHSNNGVYFVTNEQDKPLFKKRLPNSLPVILGALEPFRKDLKREVLSVEWAKIGCYGRFSWEEICLLMCGCADNLSNHTDSFRFGRTFSYSSYRQESVILSDILPSSVTLI